MLPEQILMIRDIGDGSFPYWTAASTDGVNLLLEPGEIVRWSGPCRVEQLKPEQWSLPVNTTLVVTDRRIAFLTTDFDKGGGGWVGFGIAGFAIAQATNAVTKYRANRRLAGTIAIGHVRHEWIQEICVRRVKKLVGGTGKYVDVTLPGAAGRVLVELWGIGVSDDPRFARWLASVVAAHRLTLPQRRSAEDEITFERYRVDGYDRAQPGESERLEWVFPGDTHELVGLAMVHLDEPKGQ